MSNQIEDIMRAGRKNKPQVDKKKTEKEEDEAWTNFKGAAP